MDTGEDPTRDPDAAAATPPESLVVTVHANGPLELHGEMRVLAADGSVLRENRRDYLCRCGNSGNKPFCDGTHRTAGFTDDGLGVRRGA